MKNLVGIAPVGIRISPLYYKQTNASEAVVVAQLVERSLPTPDVHGSNPVIGKLLYRTFICLLSTVLKRQK